MVASGLTGLCKSWMAICLHEMGNAAGENRDGGWPLNIHATLPAAQENRSNRLPFCARFLILEQPIPSHYPIHVIHPHTQLQFISPEIGFGVVATRRIPKGTITWVQDKLDRILTPEDVKALGPSYRDMIDTYAYRNNVGSFVLCWDNGRFVNHSFKANCLSTAYDFELAIRDIEPGEQLTDDYGYLNVSEPFTGFDEGTRRKTVYADDVLRYRKSWDKLLRSAFPKAVVVEQPLRPVMSDDMWALCERVATGLEEMVSIANNYFPDPDYTGRKRPDRKKRV